MLIKICGIKTKTAAVVSVKYGADFLGFNFVSSSKRKIIPIAAQKIIDSLPKSFRPITVGVFMDQSRRSIKKVLSQMKLDMLQFHGQESSKFCQSFGLPYIKAFGVGKQTSVAGLTKAMKKYKAKYFLLDRPTQGRGRTIDLGKVKQLAQKFPIILAGGLTPENVHAMIIKAGQIKGVDVAGGVETNGKKNIKKIRLFIKKTKI
jgi:phosphoribosylanthranilate isomerase